MRNRLILVLAMSVFPWYAVAVAQQSKDEAAIRAQEARWREVVARKDTAAIKTFYTKDGVYAPDNASAPYSGIDSVSARWSREFEFPAFRLERTPIQINVASSGDLA